MKYNEMKPCAKKKLTKREAEEHLNHLRRKGNIKKGRIYQCRVCVGSWHITHKEKFNKEETGGVKEVELTRKEKWEKLIEK